VGSIDSAISRIPHIEEKIDMVLTLLKENQYQELPEWIDLKTACEYKGVNYETVRDRPDLQPDRSKRRKVSGKWMWPRDVIIEWIKKTDDDLGYKPEPKHAKLKVAG